MSSCTRAATPTASRPGRRAAGRRPLRRRAGRGLLRREHVLARAATPARWPWSTWSTGCAPAASCCSTRSSSPSTCSASARSRSAAPAYRARLRRALAVAARFPAEPYPFGRRSARRDGCRRPAPAPPARAPGARRSRSPRHRRPGAPAPRATGSRRTSSRVNAVSVSLPGSATAISRKAALSGGSVGGVSRQARGVMRSVPKAASVPTGACSTVGPRGDLVEPLQHRHPIGQHRAVGRPRRRRPAAERGRRTGASSRRRHPLTAPGARCSAAAR